MGKQQPTKEGFVKKYIYIPNKEQPIYDNKKLLSHHEIHSWIHSQKGQ